MASKLSVTMENRNHTKSCAPLVSPSQVPLARDLELKPLKDAIVDLRRRAGRNLSPTLISWNDLVARATSKAQQAPNIWRITGRSTSSNKRDVRRVMPPRWLINSVLHRPRIGGRACALRAGVRHHHAGAVISE